MSTTKRLISGTASSWARIGVTMLTQVVLVPVFLSYWDVKTYGVWLAIQALVNVFGTFDRGYNDFLQFEFLKLGTNKRREIADLLWSGMSVVFVVSCLESTLLCLLIANLDIRFLFDRAAVVNENFSRQVGWALFIQWLAWVLTNGVGLLIRALFSFGHYARMGWGNVGVAVITSFIPVITIINGAGLLETCIWTLAGTVVALSIQLIDIYYLLIRENIQSGKINLPPGFGTYYTSLALSGRYFLENFRQQGVRLLLSPLSGASELAAFVTMRTGANVALQGLSTITNPLMPDLMRFLTNKDQDRMQAAFDTVWLVVLVLLVPAVLVLQIMAPGIFAEWTKGLITYDPYLFAILSLGVLVYALAQPATAVVTGNNLLTVQIKISLISSLIIIAGAFWLIPSAGIIALGVLLLLAEIIVAAGFQLYAKKWLISVNMHWPRREYLLVINSLIVTSIGMLLICALPDYQWIWLTGACLFQCWIIKNYWKNVSCITAGKIAYLLDRIPFLGRYCHGFIKV